MNNDSGGEMKCPQCHDVYPPGSSKCEDDGSDLIPNPPDRLIGKTFADKYEMLSLLGEGGMSKVYKARHKFMKRMVAVKILHESATKDPTAKARFQQEAEASSALSHQNVVTVHDFGFTPSGQAFFVMDCLEGKSLAEILEEKPILPLPEAIDYFTQACDGLEHAHKEGIIHRDIKPSNLVIVKQKDGTELVKLVDFGIAKLTKHHEGERPQQLTQAGEIFGTPAYMSPEQCNGGKHDARSDLYSFGCLMYEALAGEPPLLGDTFINTVVKHISERPKPFSESSPHANVPPHLESVILKCLEKDQNDRYASALELKQALFDAAYSDGVKGLRVGAVPVLKNSGTSTTAKLQIPSMEPAVQSPLKKYSIWAAIGTGTLCLTTFVWWFFLNPGPAGDTGTVFNKVTWQHQISSADDLVKEQKYTEAIKELESARELAKTKFEDNRGRYQTTLMKLGDAYGQARRFGDQESINKEIVKINTERVFIEFDATIKLLKQWETPTDSSSKKEERAQQAAAFSERIARLADKLYIRSREKEELLLKRAIKVFDAMEVHDWRSQVRFRTSLAECYRVQQRFVEQRELLEKAASLCPETPDTPDAWRQKVSTYLLLGQLNRNEAISTEQLNKAKEPLEHALKWTREHLSSDAELLRDTLNSMVVTERLYHTKESDDKAKAYELEAKSLESKLDQDAEKDNSVQPAGDD